MAFLRALVLWKEVVFFALLLLAFNVSARELVGTNVVARTVREMAMESNGVIGRRLIAQQLDISWRGNYSPPPPRYPPRPPPPPPPPPPPRYTLRPSLPRSGSRPLPPP